MSETGSHDNVSDEKLPSEQENGTARWPRADDPFADPGLPPHEPRVQDIDERAAKRSERIVALLFTVSMLATLGFIARFVVFPVDKFVYIWPIGHVSALNFALGLTLGVALFCIGAGAVHWARTLMSDEELVDERHADRGRRRRPGRRSWRTSGRAPRSPRSAAVTLIRRTMFGALALVPLSGVVLLRDLGPLPEDKLRHTLWAKGKLLVNENTKEPLRPEDITVGSLTFAMPEGLEEHDEEFQKEIAKAALMLVRLEPQDIKDKRELDWSHEGIVAYSKICTHVGCPSASTSSRRTTCSARATSRRSTCRTVRE